MKTIQKNREPSEWIERRNTPGAIYEAISQLRKSLIEEQGYICAYCMQRIETDKSKIEHIKCQERYPDQQLDYNNLVICCYGNSNEMHCDNSKGKQDISFSLFDQDLEKSISYKTKDGKITSCNTTWDRELNEVLNLNNPLLKKNRAEVLSGIISVLEKKQWKSPKLKRILNKYESKNTEGKYESYCGIAIWFLKKKIQSASQ